MNRNGLQNNSFPEMFHLLAEVSYNMETANDSCTEPFHNFLKPVLNVWTVQYARSFNEG